MPQPFHSTMFAMNVQSSVSGIRWTDRAFENISPFLSEYGAVAGTATQDTVPVHEEGASACDALV